MANQTSGNPQPSSRERALEAAILHLIEHEWPKLPIPPGKTRPYHANRLRQMIVPGCKRYVGGVRAVKERIRSKTSGLDRLSGYPELTLEALVASGHWDDLFDDEDRQIASETLRKIQ